ncbi:ABC transporter ATP-binding protein [Candidatus Berkelbacteria bacterium]|nr:ABC transporter ATP-binding protein [Candidatus Berkelbacteria bacterium]
MLFFRLGSAAVRGLLPLGQAYIAGQLINGLVAVVAGSGPTDFVYGYLILGAVVLLLERAFQEFSSYYDSRFEIQFDQVLERTVLEKILSLDQSYYEKSDFTTLVTKVRENLYSLRDFVAQLTNVLASLIGVAGSAAILATFNPYLLILIGFIVVPFTIVELRQNKQMSEYWDHSSDQWRLHTFLRWSLFGSLTSLKELKLYRADQRFLNRFLDLSTSLELSRLTIRRRGQVGQFFVQLAGVASDLGIQAWLIARVIATRGGFGIGDFQFYRGVIQNFGSEMSSLAFAMSRLQESLIYINDYFLLMSYEPRLSQPRRGIRLDPAHPPIIRFDHVSFRYPTAHRAILNDVSFELRAGEHLAIVGANGAGKTTLLKLLLRLYDPTAGRVFLGDQPLPSVDLTSWYEQLGFLFQDFERFGPLSVRDNITLGAESKSATNQRLAQAIKFADAKSFIDALPAGIDQILDPSFKGGTELSGGQWQRLALARSFYRAPNVLILDEPTSAIDAATEHAIVHRLFKAQTGKSMIVVSHRFSTVRRADRIIVLDRGKVVEQGTHRELIRFGGRYKELFELQAEGYKVDG